MTLEALEPFRTEACYRAEGDPPPLPHLCSDADRARGAFTSHSKWLLRSERMRERREPPSLISRGNFRTMYWTIAQLLTHHASNGCNLRPGDLLASGTVSGPEPLSRGCLLERTWRGAEPITLPDGDARSFLHDGDEVVLRGYCEREAYRRIAFGSCTGVVRPSRHV